VSHQMPPVSDEAVAKCLSNPALSSRPAKRVIACALAVVGLLLVFIGVTKSLHRSPASLPSPISTTFLRYELAPATSLLVMEGVSVQLDKRHTMSGNKVMVIDNQTVLIGSLNLMNGEANAPEDLTVIQDARMAMPYLTNWNSHQEHSIYYPAKP
jgi:hypothetical protein